MFKTKLRELPVPPDAAADKDATEVARLWTDGNAGYVSVGTHVFEEPGIWGIVIADLARHVANAYAQAEGHDPDEVLQRIKALFDAEWEAPTDTPTGALL